MSLSGRLHPSHRGRWTGPRGVYTVTRVAARMVLNRPRRGRQGAAPRGRAAEATINVSMAEVLDGMRHAWRARGERMGRVLSGGRRPDILVTRDGTAPVIIETEFMPANTLESDVRERLNAETPSGQRVGGVVGVRVPDRFRQLDGGQQIRNELGTSDDLEYAVWSPNRFPEREWLGQQGV